MIISKIDNENRILILEQKWNKYYVKTTVNSPDGYLNELQKDYMMNRKRKCSSYNKAPFRTRV